MQRVDGVSDSRRSGKFYTSCLGDAVRLRRPYKGRPPPHGESIAHGDTSTVQRITPVFLRLRHESAHPPGDGLNTRQCEVPS